MRAYRKDELEFPVDWFRWFGEDDRIDEEHLIAVVLGKGSRAELQRLVGMFGLDKVELVYRHHWLPYRHTQVETVYRIADFIDAQLVRAKIKDAKDRHSNDDNKARSEGIEGRMHCEPACVGCQRQGDGNMGQGQGTAN